MMRTFGRPHHPEFNSADRAWRSCISAISRSGTTIEPVRDPTSIGSLFGEHYSSTRELMAYQFVVSTPRNRVIRSNSRPLNIGHAVAQLFWILCGSDDARVIAFYHRFGLRLSDDGKTLAAAPGPRLFSNLDDGQFDSAIQRLQRDRSSRRAVVSMFGPADQVRIGRDIPCFLALQFLIRNDKLVAIASMRSQSAALVLPYDLFLLTMLHEIAASTLQLEMGPYYHWAGSLHYYHREAALVSKVLAEPLPRTKGMPAMPSLTPNWRRQLVLAEADVRRRLMQKADGEIDFSNYDLDPYWSGLLAVLVAGARKEHGVNPLDSDLSAVPHDLANLVALPKTDFVYNVS